MSGRVEDAEEAFSRAALLALEKYPRQREELVDPRRWLVRLTYNVCMDLHREAKREQARQLADIEAVETAAVSLASAEVSNPERRFLNSEQHAFLMRSIHRLPTRLRVVMEGVVLEELSYRELSDRLAVSELALRKRMQQARSILRRRQAAYSGGKAKLEGPPNAAGETADPGSPGEALPRAEPWSVPCPVAAEAVRILLPSGLERDVLLWLVEEPRRPSARRQASLERYIVKHPSGWKKRLELARLLRRRGRFEEAVPHYREVTRRQPSRPAAWVELASILEALGRSPEAAEVCERSARAARRKATEQHCAGLAAAVRGRLREAAAALREAARLEPDNPAHPFALGRALLAGGWDIDAAEAFDAALEIDADAPLALALSHDALSAAGRSRKAGRRVARALELDDTCPLVLSRWVELRSRSRRVEGEEGRETRRLLRRLRRLAPGHRETLRALAGFHLARGAWEVAEREIADQVDAHPAHAAAWCVYGEVLERVGKIGPAGSAHERAFELDPADREIRTGLARVLPRSGSAGRAQELLEETLARCPEDAGVLRRAAVELAGLAADRVTLLGLLDRAERLQPRSSPTAVCRGEVLRRLGETEGAVAAFEQGWARLAADDGLAPAAETALALGECWQQLGDRRRSDAWYRAAYSHATGFLDEDPAHAERIRGLACRALGDTAAAAAALRRALAHQLPYPERAAVASLLRRLSQFPENSGEST